MPNGWPSVLAQSNNSGRKPLNWSRETQFPAIISLLWIPSRTILPFPHTTCYFTAPSTTKMNAQGLRYQRNVWTEPPDGFWEDRPIMMLPSHWAKEWLATSTENWESKVWMLNCPNTELFQMKPHVRDTGTESFRQKYIFSQSQPQKELKYSFLIGNITHYFSPHTPPQNQQQNTNLMRSHYLKDSARQSGKSRLD